MRPKELTCESRGFFPCAPVPWNPRDGGFLRSGSAFSSYPDLIENGTIADNKRCGCIAIESFPILPDENSYYGFLLNAVRSRSTVFAVLVEAIKTSSKCIRQGDAQDSELQRLIANLPYKKNVRGNVSGCTRVALIVGTACCLLVLRRGRKTPRGVLKI